MSQLSLKQLVRTKRAALALLIVLIAIVMCIVLHVYKFSGGKPSIIQVLLFLGMIAPAVWCAIVLKLIRDREKSAS